MHDTGIYCITDVQSGRRYVGSAASIKKRWGEHRRGLSKGTHHSRFLQRTFNSRPDSISFQVLIHCSKENLLMYEQRFLDAWKPDFNTAPTAGSQLGLRMSDESKAKLSEAAKRTRNFTGKSHSEESKRKISESRKGKGGGYRSPERCANISRALKGRPVSHEMRARISAALMGHKQSAEQIEKRMQKIRGRKMPEGFAEATSARMKGIKLPAAHCLSIGKSKAILSDEQVRAIRARSSEGAMRKTLAAEFQIDPASITNIVNRKSYRWVD